MTKLPTRILLSVLAGVLVALFGVSHYAVVEHQARIDAQSNVVNLKSRVIALESNYAWLEGRFDRRGDTLRTLRGEKQSVQNAYQDYQTNETTRLAADRAAVSTLPLSEQQRRVRARYAH
jgi:hypothetical protein